MILLGVIAGYIESGDEDSGIEDVLMEGIGAGVVMGSLAGIATVMGGIGIVEATSLHGILFGDIVSGYLGGLQINALISGVSVGVLTVLDAAIPGYLGGSVIHSMTEEGY